jgi:uncharacterized YigZ family protein
MLKEYRTIHKNSESIIEIKKSKFIGRAFPCSNEEEAVKHIEETNKEFYDATHTAYAYIIGNNAEIQKFNDDGEPSGTAGLPILNYLKTEELRNILVTVTRYYGGIKLGKGGLIRAYSGSARETINNNIIVTKKIVVETHIIISYNLYGGVENLLQNENLIVKDKNFEKDVTIKILVLEEDIKKIKEKLINYTSDNIEFQDKEKKFMSVHNNKIII